MEDFRFRLDSVLAHKQRVYERAQQDLARAQRVLEAELGELAAVEIQEHAQREQFRQQHGGEVDVVELLRRVQYLSHLAQEKQDRRRHVTTREEEVCRCMQELIVLAKNKKILEKLKDKQLRDFLKQLAAHEQKIIDACAISRHNRQQPRRAEEG